MAGKSWSQGNPITSEDLSALAAEVVAGLRVHVTGNLQLGLEQLLREQEKRLLAALVPECSSSANIKSAAHARLLGPTRRLHTGSRSNSTTSTARCFLQSSGNIAGTRVSTEEDLRLEVRSVSKKSQSQCSLTENMRSPRGNLQSAINGLKHNETEKRWLKLLLPHLSSDAAPLAPSGVRSLSEARDRELLAVVPDTEVCSSSSIVSKNRKGEQLPTFNIDSDVAHLPGVVGISSPDSKRSPSGGPLDQARGPVEQAPAATAAATAGEFHPRAGSSSGHAGSEAASTSATGASPCQFTYEQFAAVLKHDGDLSGRPCHQPKQSQGDRTSGTTPCNTPGVQGQPLAPYACKTACAPRQKSSSTTATLEENWEAGAAPPMRYATTQSISTLSSSPSMLSSCTPRDAAPAKLVSERACTGELNREPARPGLLRILNARAFDSDTKAACLRLEQALQGESGKVRQRSISSERSFSSERIAEMMKPGSRRNPPAKYYCSETKAACLKREQELLGDSSKVQERTLPSERRGATTKPGSRRSLCARKYSSDTKAVRLNREEELLRGIGDHSTEGQEQVNSEQTKLGKRRRTLQAAAFASDTKAMNLKRQEELLCESCKPSTSNRHSTRAQERAPSEPTNLGSHRSLPARVCSPDTLAADLKRGEDLPGEARQPSIRHRQSSKACEQLIAPERNMEPARPALPRTFEAKAFAPETQMMRWKQLEAGNELMLEGFPTVVEESSRLQTPATLCGGETDHALVRRWCMGQRVDSPLLLRLCGLLPWGRFWVVHRCVVPLLAACLVAVFAGQLYRGQRRITGAADCHSGICVHFGHLSDLVLSMGCLLGVLAMRTLASQRLLGSPTALLTRFAIEEAVVQKWSCASSWNSLYLALLWAGSLAFRAAAVPSGPCWMDAVPACAFALASLIFMSLVFSILHVSCIICILIDNYSLKVSDSMDPVRSVQEWDKLGALLRNVSRAVDRGFLLVQITAMAVLLSSFTDLMLQGDQQIWCFLSNMLLAQSLILSLSKAAEATEMCTRLPSVINTMDFGGDDFSLERHYLVEHISYSAAGFYVGEIRLTAAIALRGVYISVVIALGVLTKLTQITAA